MRYTRKVQGIGSSLLVSLPKQWAYKHGIKKGSILFLEVLDDDTLKMYPTLEAKESREVTISYPLPYYEHIADKITGAYLLGYDVIRVKSSRAITYEEREMIKNAIERLVSLEIVDEDATNIVAQFLLDTTTLEPEKILYRMSAIVSGMYRDVIVALENRDKAILKTIARRDDEVDRQYFLLVRLLRSALRDGLTERMGLSSIEVLDYRIAAHLLENAGDSVVELARAIDAINLESYSSNDNYLTLIKIAKSIDAIQDLSVKTFIGKNRSGSLEVIAMYKRLIEQVNSCKHNLDASMLNILYLIDKFSRVWIDIADLVIPLEEKE
jgi:phosphate uptake regulator